MVRIIIVMLCVCQGLSGFAQTKIIIVFDGKAEIELPAGYQPMSAQEVTRRYPTSKINPSEAYNSEDGMTVFAFFPQKDKRTIEQMIAEKDKLFDTFKNSKRVKWGSGEVKTINGQKYIILSFNSRQPVFNVVNYQVFGSIKGSVVMFSVTCPSSFYNAKKSEIERTINSFKLK